MKITDKEFCKMYTSFYGEEIDKVVQLVKSTFTGEELKEFIEHCIKLNSLFIDVNYCFCDGRAIETAKGTICYECEKPK